MCACVLIGIVRTLRFHTGGIRLFFLYFFRFSIFDLSIETEVSLLGFVLRGVWFLQSTKRYILIHLIKGKMQTAFEICSRSLLIYVCSNLRVLCSAQRTKWNENTNKFVLGKYDTGNASNSLHENINKRNFLWDYSSMLTCVTHTVYKLCQYFFYSISLSHENNMYASIRWTTKTKIKM